MTTTLIDFPILALIYVYLACTKKIFSIPYSLDYLNMLEFPSVLGVDVATIIVTFEHLAIFITK